MFVSLANHMNIAFLKNPTLCFTYLSIFKPVTRWISPLYVNPLCKDVTDWISILLMTISGIFSIFLIQTRLFLKSHMCSSWEEDPLSFPPFWRVMKSLPRNPLHWGSILAHHILHCQKEILLLQELDSVFCPHNLKMKRFTFHNDPIF